MVMARFEGWTWGDSSIRREEHGLAQRGIVAHQAQSSTGRLAATTGAAGAAGLLAHHAPQQRRGLCGSECGRSADASNEIGSTARMPPSARSGITSLKNEGSCAQSALDVTKSEHPARTAQGAIKTQARVVKHAPVRTSANRRDSENLIIQHHSQPTSSDCQRPEKSVIRRRTPDGPGYFADECEGPLAAVGEPWSARPVLPDDTWRCAFPSKSSIASDCSSSAGLNK
jgi:hypothetical protein